jgi:hypothetical protein
MAPLDSNPRVQSPRVEDHREDHLDALGRLVERTFADPTLFFEHGLSLLVQQLDVECAMLARLSNRGMEPTWWICQDEQLLQHILESAKESLTPEALIRSRRTFMIHDASLNATWKDRDLVTRAGIRGFLGGVLWQEGHPEGILCVLDRRPRRFKRPEIALFTALANLMARTLEVELLKSELRMARDALDLATAVVEDTAYLNAATGLPSGHFLDVWLRANLFTARRREEGIVIVEWRAKPDTHPAERLRDAAETLRGDDLLVDLGRGEFLLLLPHTDREGAAKVLERLREVLGPIPMGATTWEPKRKEDREDMAFHATRGRAHKALAASVAQGGGEVLWLDQTPAESTLGVR